MEQEKTTCPYCGEEILAVAKKCKHCGEWLDEDYEDKEELEDEEQYEDDEYEGDVNEENKEKHSLDWDFWGQALMWVAIIVVAIILNPSESKHRKKIQEELRVSVKKELKKESKKALKSGDVISYGAGQTAMEKEEALDAFIDDKWSIDISNYWVLSLGKVKETDTGDSKTVSIGVFGFVLVKDIPFNW